MAAAANSQSKLNNKFRGIGADGLPRLPPIERPEKKADPYADSKLMNFRMANHKQALLRKIM